ncbi:MAG: thiaminase II/PqqC family protein, partial [Planctomycetota bacterium]
MQQFEEARLVLGSGDLWEGATRAPFLDGVGNSSLPKEAFERWLVQDFLFVQGLTSFASIVAARAPREAQRVAIQGLTALNDELDWFEGHLGDRKLDAGAAHDPVCRRYVDHL